MTERNYSKYSLAICHLFHPTLHGYTHNSDRTILSHYLVFWSVELDDFFENHYNRSIEDLQSFYNNIILNNYPHPIIRNYLNIFKRENYIKLEIVEIDVLSGFEEIATLKTFWLKLIQRKWKKIFYERKKKIKKLSNPKNLLKREIHGK